MPIDNINAFLGNSPRTDLIGPEMWTLCTKHAVKENDDSIFIGGQMPFQSWSPPRPGLNGLLCITHMTELRDLIQVEVAECDGRDRAVLRLVPTRNLWTPARLTTCYRSAPSLLGTDYPKSGTCSMKETKCITSDNVFIAELEIGNCSPVPRSYELTFRTELTEKLEEGGGSGRVFLSGRLDFTTEAMCRKTPRTSFAAFVATVPGLTWRLEIAPWKKQTIRYAFSLVADSADAALAKVGAAIDDDTVFENNVAHFNRWFHDNVPVLESGNPDLLKMYYYRWFVVYRGIHETRRLIPDHEYPRPVMYESPMGGWYDCVIGLPVPMQIQEAAWLRTPQTGWDHILNWAEDVKGYRGYIQFTPMAIWRFYAHHPDRDRLSQSFASIRNFTPWTEELPVQRSSWPTGAEYQPNFYQFTTPPWDYRNDSELWKSAAGLQVASSIRLDTAGFAIGNLIATKHMAGILGRRDDREELGKTANRLLAILREKHWDTRLGLFLAADPVSGRLADQAACYDSFVPYMWGMIGEPQYLKAFDKLLDNDWFWDDFPVLTVAKNCPMYFDNNAIIGPTEASMTQPHDYGCCWNGPVWNYANSLIAEAFGQGAIRRPELQRGWLDFFSRWTDVQFLYGDRSVPYATEHHRPGDGARHGTPSEYFHSSWLDPFFSYWCGIRMDDDLKTIVFDPFTEEDFSVAHVPLAGKEYTFVQKKDPSGDQCERVVYDRGGHELARKTGSRPLTLWSHGKDAGADAAGGRSVPVSMS